jgi:ankyrin repeat protein
MIDLLIGHGASLEVADYDGRSPLHYSVILGHAETARRLCTHKKLLNSQDSEGKSALHLVWTKLIPRTEEVTTA